jgi:arginine/lysine/ornithine decarboxylase
LCEAAGRVSAELLCPYPPGVPLALPGERLTTAVIRQLKLTLAQGGVVTGASDSRLNTVTVVVA